MAFYHEDKEDKIVASMEDDVFKFDDPNLEIEVRLKPSMEKVRRDRFFRQMLADVIICSAMSELCDYNTFDKVLTLKQECSKKAVELIEAGTEEDDDKDTGD